MKLFIYGHRDLDNQLEETKWGQHFVTNENVDPVEDTIKYIRQKQYPRRGKHFDSGRVRYHIEEITDWATKNNLMYIGSKADDVIRPSISRPGTQGTEWGKGSFDEHVANLNKFLFEQDQVLPNAGLGTIQYLDCVETIKQFKNGARKVLWDKCPRYAKTITSGVIPTELESDLVIVTSYVQTVFGSFAGDFFRFEQFKQFTHIDTKRLDYQEVITKLLKEGKKVMAYLSVCSGGERQTRYDFFNNINADKFWILDEADFGAHTPKQAPPLVEAVGDDRIIIMSGSGADKASKHWKIDYQSHTQYTELLVQKGKTKAGDITKCKGLKYFKHSTERDLLFSGIELHRANLGPLVTDLEKQFPDDTDYFASWSKAGEFPQKAKGFITGFAKAVFLGQKYDNLNRDFQFSTSKKPPVKYKGITVEMMFMNVRKNVNLQAMSDIFNDVLPNTMIVTLCGDNEINGVRCKGSKIEQLTLDAIEDAAEKGMNVLIISSRMGQRSYSIPMLSTVYLCYDNGQLDATLQKLSRVLTPDSVDKVGRVIDCSFDPNRSDKFDAMVIQSAINQKLRTGQTASQTLNEVLKTISPFDWTDNGLVQIAPDQYLKEAMNRNAISRVIGNQINIGMMSIVQKIAIAEGCKDYKKQSKIDAITKGNTRDSMSKNSNGTPKITDKTEKQIREALVFLMENVDYMIYGSGSDNIVEARKTISKDNKLQENIEDRFNVPWTVIDSLFEDNVINQTHVEFAING